MLVCFRCVGRRAEWSPSKLRAVISVWMRSLVSPPPVMRRRPRCCFESAIADLHGLLALPVELLGFGRSHLRLVRLDQFLMFVPPNAPPAARIIHATTTERTGEAIVARDLITQINGALVPGSLPGLSAYVYQFFARRAMIRSAISGCHVNALLGNCDSGDDFFAAGVKSFSCQGA